MVKSRRVRAFAFLSVLIGLVAALASSRLTVGSVRTEDRNGDGRPDVWRAFDEQGRPVAVSIDTNFDGRVDVHEYYAHGSLLRRESDRDFNSQVDLVEEFDIATHEHLRSVVDVNSDGIGDLLVLFQSGRPVYSKWALGIAPRPETSRATLPTYSSVSTQSARNAQLTSLVDPFGTDTGVRETRAILGSDTCVALSTSGGLPRSPADSIAPVMSSARLTAGGAQSNLTAGLSPRSPRGPPLS
jgi:hypothetical protein